MSNVTNFGSILALKKLTADPASAPNGSLYFNTTTGKVRIYQNAAWDDAATATQISTGFEVITSSSTPVSLTTASGRFVLVTGTAAQTIHMPSGAANGAAYTIKNVTTQPITVQDAATTAVVTIPAGTNGNIIWLGTSWGADVSMNSFQGGNYNAGGVGISNVLNPAAAQDAATKNYVDTSIAAIPATDLTPYLKKDGSVAVTGSLTASATTVDLGSPASSFGSVYLANNFSSLNILSAGSYYAQMGRQINLPSGKNGFTTLLRDTAGALDVLGFGTQSRAAGVGSSNSIVFETGSSVDAASGDILLSTGTGVTQGKISLSGSLVDLNSKKIINLADPTLVQDAATKNYVDTQSALKLSLSGGTMSGNIAMGNNEITGLAAPTTANSAATKNYVDTAITGLDFQKDVDGVQIDATLVPSLVLGKRYIVTNVAALHANFGTIAGVANNDIVEYNGSAFVVAYNVAVMGSGALVWDKATLVFYRYNGTNWAEFGGLSGITAGIGLSKTGNVLDINLGAGIAQLPTDEVGIDLYSAGAIDLVDPVSGLPSVLTDAKISVKLDGATLSKSTAGLKIATGGVANNEVAANAAIAYNKLASLSTAAPKALVSDASGFVSESTVTGTELSYLSGVTSAIQTQFSGKANTDLGNLAATTAINVDLTPATADAIQAGTQVKPFSQVNSNIVHLAAAGTLNGTIDRSTGVGIRVLANRTNESVALYPNGTGSVAAVSSSGLVIQNQTAGAVVLSTLKATLAASQATFATVAAALNFTSAVSKSKSIQYEIVDSVTGDARTGKLVICLGAANEVGYSDVFVSSNVSMDTIELLPVNTAGSCDIQFKGTGTNACTFKVISSSVSVNDNLF